MGFEGPLRDWVNGLVHFVIFYGYPLLLISFLLLLGLGIFIATMSADNFWSGLRRFLGVIVPVIVLLCLGSAGIFSRVQLMRLFSVPVWQLSLGGFVVGVGIVEFYRLFQYIDDDLPMALANMLLATIGALTIMLFVLPDLPITVLVMGPLFLGIVLTIIFRGWPFSGDAAEG